MLEFLEDCLHLRAQEWHEAVGELLQHQLLQTLQAGKKFSRAFRFGFSCSDCAEHNPIELNLKIISDQTKDCPSAADFNIIGVRSETQHTFLSVAATTESNLQH